ncbi:RNA-binding (RRM/RBD/RNP motifs) family protein [Striga hermonthica]|uniref:RNA-binding (RRM/RBD/RNP motifs) family protein n=1 Tax=Striga hermonthica TaxID=68872 RepID=A0A9N7N295_STRHE|nr:RNA-binding (RRM/RBD/RNP motifs) family protein [Striga hermonthica]
MAHPPPYEPFYLPPPPPEYVYSGGERNGINTLFISGLPDDVMPREIHNLFRRRPGFDSCQLKYTGRGNQVVAFVTFVNHQSAMAALHSLNGVKFDPQTGSTLHIELARSNSRRKHKPGSGPYVVIDNRKKSDADAGGSSSDGGQEAFFDFSFFYLSKFNLVSLDQADKRTDGACSTLFIANLGPNCTETELKQYISQYQGFNSLKVSARGGMPVAFADFERVEQATEAMNLLQGCLLPSSDRGGMHIEYARSKMRKP